MSFLTFSRLIAIEVLKGNIKSVSYYKYYSRWKRSISPGHNSLIDELPWITFKALDFIKKNIPHGAKVFEYGGGGSTLFFLNNASEVVTAEHDAKWVGKLENIIKSKNIRGWTGNLIMPETVTNNSLPDISNPKDYYSSDENFRTSTFKEYTSFIEKYPDNYFDIVLIDGRARPSCMVHSFKKIKKGGFLILDNSERVHYLKNEIILKELKNYFSIRINEYSVIPYISEFTQTTIWEKIK